MTTMVTTRPIEKLTAVAGWGGRGRASLKCWPVGLVVSIATCGLLASSATAGPTPNSQW